MKQPAKKPINWKMDDFYKLANIVGITEMAFKKEARKITKTFLEKMPIYIELMKDFEKTNPLPMQKTRIKSDIPFSTKLSNMFKEKVITLKKLGIIKELELIDEAGGLLSAENKRNS
jgi:hypothetical protein